MKVSTCPPAARQLQALLEEAWPSLTWRMTADDCGVDGLADFDLEPVPLEGPMGLGVHHYTEAGEEPHLAIEVYGADRMLFHAERPLVGDDLRPALQELAQAAQAWLQALAQLVAVAPNLQQAQGQREAA